MTDLRRTGVALVAAVAVALYLNALGGALLYDDLNAITRNALVTGGDVRGILTTPSWWGDGRGTLWRPLTTLSFALDHALWGLAPFGYHLVNVALHAGVSVLAMLVFRAAGVAAPRALAAALLFASHPVHTEAVASVVGRAELLAAAGFFLAWRAWLAADAAAGARAAAWTGGAIFAYVLAMLAKENAVALPAVLLLADLLRRDVPGAAFRRRRAPRYAALVVAALLFVALRHRVLGETAPAVALLDNPLAHLPLGPRLLTAVRVLGLYAYRLVVPLRLAADYSYDQIPAVTTPLDPGFLAGLGAIGAAAAGAWWARRRRPELTLGLGMLGLTFALVSNLVVPIGTIMGERLLYLPSAGFCLALAAGLAAVGGGDRRRPFWTAIAIVVALYGVRTVARNPVWRDPLVFARRMVADAPRSARSHAELASALAEAGRFADAHAAFARALAIKPADPVLLYNQGNAFLLEGRWDAAADAYRAAIAAKPAFGQAWENLGLVESARGDQQAALAALRRARELTPDSPYVVMTIANVLARAGAAAEARATFEEALARRPDDPEVLASYGIFLSAAGEHAAAIALLERIPPHGPAQARAALAASAAALGRHPDGGEAPSPSAR